MKTIEDINKQFNELKLSVDNANTFFQTKTIVDDKKIKHRDLIIICITIVLVFSLIANMYFVHELSRIDKLTETTNTEDYDIEQHVDGNSNINNVNGNQYNDNATHNESKGSD